MQRIFRLCACGERDRKDYFTEETAAGIMELYYIALTKEAGIMYVCDLHCDTLLEIWLSELRNERLSLKDTGKAKEPLHIDLKKMQEGGYLLQNFAIYADLHMPAASLSAGGTNPALVMPGEALSAAKKEEEAYADPWFQTMEMIRVFKEEMAANADLIGQVFSFQDIEKNRKAGRMSAVLTTEEGGIIKGDLTKLDTLYDAGVRMMTVTWNYDNELGHPNRLPTGVREDFRNFYRFVPESGRGLTSVGKEAVARMEELGIIPDVSHLSDDGFYDVADIVKGPFAASHSNARALCGCSRNLTDDMIRTVAEHGGVIGLNFCPSFVMEAEDESRCFTSCEALAAHVRHIMNVGGREVIAFGTDFDGIPRRNLEIQNASMMQQPADYMLGHGFTMEEVEGLYYKNVLRLYREVL